MNTSKYNMVINKSINNDARATLIHKEKMGLKVRGDSEELLITCMNPTINHLSMLSINHYNAKEP
mgnify:CR=1 FL=1